MALGVKIASIGTLLPEAVLTNAELEKMVDTSDEWITSRTGIKERRIAPPGVGASYYALGAARKALAKAEVKPEEVDLIIVATVTPDYPMPATACLVQAKLGAARAAAFDLNAACSGFIYALSIGSQFIKSGVYGNVLIVGVDLLSRFLDWQDRSTCVLFGDGAGAVLLQPAPEGEGVLAAFLGSDGNKAGCLQVEAGGSLKPASRETLATGKQYLKMEGNEIFKYAVKEMEKSMLAVLAQCNFTPGDISYLVPHQANYRIITAIRKRLGLKENQIIVNINRYGNMSAASIPVAMEEAAREGKFKKGDIIGLSAFGAGLTWGAAVLRW
ncbi:MAG TPA: ketoacyl-ACP synthase III [Firmicutes bacterium]|nr:ketoacyl-ACP synthase III [Bacillota bacterium]